MAESQTYIPDNVQNRYSRTSTETKPNSEEHYRQYWENFHRIHFQHYLAQRTPLPEHFRNDPYSDQILARHRLEVEKTKQKDDERNRHNEINRKVGEIWQALA